MWATNQDHLATKPTCLRFPETYGEAEDEMGTVPRVLCDIVIVIFGGKYRHTYYE